MAKCLECSRDLKISLGGQVKNISCNYCQGGYYRLTQSAGYFVAIELVQYFILVVVVGVVLMDINLSDIFFHIYTAGSEGTLASHIVIAGYFLWTKL